MRSPKSVAKLTVRMIGNLLIAAVFLASVAFILPSLFGYHRYVIMGGSMTGTFNIGSIVFEKTTPVKDLKVGDVITYLPPADSGVPNLVTHRIVKIRPNAKTGGYVFRTKGDHNPQRDPWKFELTGAVQPKVQFGVPYAGFFFIALANRDTRMKVIGVPAALIALFSLAEIGRAVRPQRKVQTSVPSSHQPLGV
jgi:signal peptidase I